MRAVLMLMIGMLVGALAAVTAVGAMKKDVPFPKASMTLMRHHFGALRKMSEGGQCGEREVQRHLRGLRAVAGEFNAFVPTGGDDATFEGHAAKFVHAIDTAIAAPPADCAALATTNRSLGGACKGCHDEFRD